MTQPETPPTQTQLWIQAARPRTLPLALASIGMGGFLAAADGTFSFLITFLCVLTTICLQVLSNFANDYGDSVHGADSDEREGPKRVTQLGLITKEGMRRAMIISAVLALISGGTLVWVSLSLSQLFLFSLFLVLGGAAVWAAIAYTATANPYGYVGLGDIFVLIFFGWVGTLGTYYLQAQSLDWLSVLPATAVGLMSVAVLNVNNTRDIESDKIAGKQSIPVRIGYANAKIYHTILLGGAVLCAAATVLLRPAMPWGWLFVLALPLIWRTGRGVWTEPQNKLDPYLKQTVLASLLLVLTLGIGLLI